MSLLGIVTELLNSSIKAYRDGHYIESAIINFQCLDVILRIAIKNCLRVRGVSEDVLTRVVDGEQRFIKLVDISDLVIPNNEFSQFSDGLRKLNTKRNALVHHLVTYDSFDSVSNEAKLFFDESQDLMLAISQYLVQNFGRGVPDVEIRGA